MHHIHHTHGFVLSSRNTGEANKMLTVYTKELGLVRAAAQGVRLNKSKLRFALQDFSYANIDFVQGRDIWRVTSAATITSFPFARGDRQSLLLIARIGRLLERLCTGEEASEKIFNDFIQALYILDDASVESSSREALELHLVLRIVNELGYIGESSALAAYLGDTFDTTQKDSLLREKRSIVAHINKALHESQL